MKYLCLLYIDEARLDTLDANELEQLAGEADAVSRRLIADGRLLAAARLLPTGVATTIRLRPGGLVITDGPATAARHQVAGFHLIHARDLNEAIRIAARIPAARHGCVEVRPVAMPFPNPTPRKGDTHALHDSGQG